MLSRVLLLLTPWTVARQACLSMRFPSENTEVDCHFLLQGISMTQGSNPRLLYGQVDFLTTEPPGKPAQYLQRSRPLWVLLCLPPASFSLLAFPETIAAAPHALVLGAWLLENNFSFHCYAKMISLLERLQKICGLY